MHPSFLLGSFALALGVVPTLFHSVARAPADWAFLLFLLLLGVLPFSFLALLVFSFAFAFLVLALSFSFGVFSLAVADLTNVHGIGVVVAAPGRLGVSARGRPHPLGLKVGNNEAAHVFVLGELARRHGEVLLECAGRLHHQERALILIGDGFLHSELRLVLGKVALPLLEGGGKLPLFRRKLGAQKGPAPDQASVRLLRVKLPPELPPEEEAVLAANPARYLQRWGAFAHQAHQHAEKLHAQLAVLFRFHRFIRIVAVTTRFLKMPREAGIDEGSVRFQSSWFLRGFGGLMACFSRSTPLSCPVKLPRPSCTGETLPTATAGGAPRCWRFHPLVRRCFPLAPSAFAEAGPPNAESAPGKRSAPSASLGEMPRPSAGPPSAQLAAGPPLPPSAASGSHSAAG